MENGTIWGYDNSSHLSNTWVTFKQVSLGAILTIFCTATIIGNLLVITAVCIVPKLQRPENLLIISLAIADELVGLVVMPFSMVYEVLDYWPFGSTVCNFYISLDITACSASILSLCMISLDRYFVISRPLQYGPQRTLKRMVFSVVLVWILSVIISATPLFFFGNDSTHYRCIISQDPVYQIYATISAFYAPVILMLVAYAKIYQAAAKISKESKIYDVNAHPLRTEEATHQKKLGSISRELLRSVLPTSCLPSRIHSTQLYGRSISSFNSRELKAFRTLTAIVVAFLASWSPFFIVALMRPFYDGMPKWVVGLTLWLGYFNSTINPALYSIFNKDFRRPFAELLRCRCMKLRRIMRTESYEIQFGNYSLDSRPVSRTRNYIGDAESGEAI